MFTRVPCHIFQDELLRISSEQSLLIAAWAYGLKENEIIHRFPLFAFVQSHIDNASEENLQGLIEKNSSNWVPAGGGHYRLTPTGYKKVIGYGTPNIVLPTSIVFTFQRAIEKYEISVSVDRRYEVKQNGKSEKPRDIVKNIVGVTKEYIPTDKTSMPRKIFNWVLLGDDYSWTIDTKIEGQIPSSVVERFRELDEEESFPEGKEKYRIHKAKERNQKLIALKKQKAFSQNPNMPCEICQFSFKLKYGEIGDKFIEAHHVSPISQLTEEVETKLDDLILVCANCHKILHRKRPWLTIEEFKKILNG
jgi:hypothetical protein